MYWWSTLTGLNGVCVKSMCVTIINKEEEMNLWGNESDMGESGWGGNTTNMAIMDDIFKN